MIDERWTTFLTMNFWGGRRGFVGQPGIAAVVRLCALVYRFLNKISSRWLRIAHEGVQNLFRNGPKMAICRALFKTNTRLESSRMSKTCIPIMSTICEAVIWCYRWRFSVYLSSQFPSYFITWKKTHSFFCLLFAGQMPFLRKLVLPTKPRSSRPKTITVA